MKSFCLGFATILLIAMAGGARAAATREGVPTDLTGHNICGRHSMKDLADDAEAGNCTAAAGLVRRARDAQGFLETNCRADAGLKARAAAELDVGKRTLRTPACQN